MSWLNNVSVGDHHCRVGYMVLAVACFTLPQHFTTPSRVGQRGYSRRMGTSAVLALWWLIIKMFHVAIAFYYL